MQETQALSRAELAASLPRGISPRILISQVRNTVPYIFEMPGQPGLTTSKPARRYLETLRQVDTQLAEGTDPELPHEDYFRLCLSAHFATVSSFVPTDVDNQIRFKLWHPALTTEIVAAMAEIVVESASWDLTAVSTRYVHAPGSPELISGIHGEWFSVAVAAYAALRRRSPDDAARMVRLILEELDREARIYRALRKAGDGIGLLKAATLIAHNLGDLDRVMDQWNLPPDDALRAVAYKAGHEHAEWFEGALVQAGKVNKEYMADENHRHFVLRGPRCLRKSPDFLLPIGPFFDQWGAAVGRHPGLSPEEVGEITEALVAGWEKLNTVGYPRALAGIVESFKGGLNNLCNYVPARVARTLKAGDLRALCATPRGRFEEQWARMALKFAASN